MHMFDLAPCIRLHDHTRRSIDTGHNHPIIHWWLEATLHSPPACTTSSFNHLHTFTKPMTQRQGQFGVQFLAWGHFRMKARIEPLTCPYMDDRAEPVLQLTFTLVDSHAPVSSSKFSCFSGKAPTKPLCIIYVSNHKFSPFGSWWRPKLSLEHFIKYNVFAFGLAWVVRCTQTMLTC